MIGRRKDYFFCWTHPIGYYPARALQNLALDRTVLRELSTPKIQHYDAKMSLNILLYSDTYIIYSFLAVSSTRPSFHQVAAGNLRFVFAYRYPTVCLTHSPRAFHPTKIITYQT